MIDTLSVAVVPLQSEAVGALGGLVALFVILVSIVGMITGLISLAGMWKSFEKAGQPGWAVIVPIYNAYVLIEIADRPAWWLLLLLVPVVNIFVIFVVFIDFAEKFGKGVGFGIGLALLGVVFFPLLGFGDAQYQGRAG